MIGSTISSALFYLFLVPCVVFHSRLRRIFANLTIVSTACYSGGWLMRKSLNISGLAGGSVEHPTGDLRKSVSGNYSLKSEGVYGEVFTTCFIRFLTGLGPKPTAIPTFNTMCHKTAGALYQVNQKPECHIFSFNTEGNAYGQAWSPRSCIPVQDFHKRGDALDESPAAPNRPCNHDPSNPLAPGYHEAESSSSHVGGLFGGTTSSQRQHVRLPPTRSRRVQGISTVVGL